MKVPAAADDAPGPGPASGWREVRVVASTGSTNADLAELAPLGEPGGLVLVAEEQTEGRGRLGRTWSAPAGSGLTFSVLLRPARDPAQLGWLPLLAGVAVAEAVRTVAGVPAGLKWPNDVVVDGARSARKVAGILAERVSGAVVVGVGINVTMRADQLPVPTATSLLLEGARTLDAAVLLDVVLARLAERYSVWDSSSTNDSPADAELHQAYRALCSTLGRPVRAELPGGTVVEGDASDVDDYGRLLVRTGTGITAVGAGDVLHLRAGGPSSP